MITIAAGPLFRSNRASQVPPLSVCLFAWLSFWVLLAIFVTYLFFLFHSLFVLCLAEELLPAAHRVTSLGPLVDDRFAYCNITQTQRLVLNPSLRCSGGNRKLLRLDVFLFLFSFHFAWLAALTPSRFSKFRKVRTPKSKTISRK